VAPAVCDVLVERTLEVRTGESVAIQYELAGLGSRFLAVGLDLAIQLSVSVAVLIGILVGAKPLARATASVSSKLTKSGEATFIAAGVFAIFLLYFGYFILFEMWWSGRTPGKRALGIRVVRDAGFPIDIGAAVIRNVVRVIEFSLGFYALSAVSAVLSRQNKRLGDFAAGTIVVRERTTAPPDIQAYLTPDPGSDDGLSANQRGLVERYVARRAQFEPRARAVIAARIAKRVRPHLRATFEHLDDDALLRHIGRGAAPRD
jgi:uncharacterized RDD family membrane protein YckC